MTYPRWFTRALFFLILCAGLIRIFYWGYTGRTWEDALISVLHSENAASGLGLTHVTPGEPPLHGFTSPLSVLVPLIGDMVHVGWGLPFLKLISVFFGGIAVWLGARICLVLGLPPTVALAAAAYLAFEHHQVMWGMAGMETQIVTVAYLWSIYVMQQGTQWQKGLSLGFTMLARPDAAIWVAIAGAVEIWRAWKQSKWRNLIPVASGLALLYGPWLIFTTVYYGTPIPNTIVAKSLGYPTVSMQLRDHSIAGKLSVIVHRFFAVLGSLGPGYAGNGRGVLPMWDHRVIALTMTILLIAGAMIAIRRRHLDALLLYAFVVSYSLYLTFFANFIFGWYTAPVVAASVIASLYGLWNLLALVTKEPTSERVAGWIGVAYIAALVSVLPVTMSSDRAIQQYVELDGRKQVGLYLASVSLPTDTIASESLGYVGYYSRRTIYDYPGLCSRRVVQYLRDHSNGRNVISMMQALRPTYLVLRPREYLDDKGNIEYPWVAQDYERIRAFKVPEEDRKKILRSEDNMDFEFDVFRAKGAPSRTPL